MEAGRSHSPPTQLANVGHHTGSAWWTSSRYHYIRLRLHGYYQLNVPGLRHQHSQVTWQSLPTAVSSINDRWPTNYHLTLGIQTGINTEINYHTGYWYDSCYQLWKEPGYGQSCYSPVLNTGTQVKGCTLILVFTVLNATDYLVHNQQIR